MNRCRKRGKDKRTEERGRSGSERKKGGDKAEEKRGRKTKPRGGELQAKRTIDRNRRTMRGTWAQEMLKERCSERSGWRRRRMEATMWTEERRSGDDGKRVKQRRTANTNPERQGAEETTEELSRGDQGR